MMEQIALISGGRLIPWSLVIVALAAAGAGCLFLGLYLSDREHMAAGACALPLAALLSVLLSRIIHWYCLPSHYSGFFAAMADPSGGYALCGVFAGCLLAAWLLGLIRICPNVPQMLDCMCVAGAAGIAVGRLASLFNASDRGPVLENLVGLPWVYPVVNPVSGSTEYRFATFLFQSLASGALFIGLFLFFVLRRRRGTYRCGDTALLFTLIYCACQIVMDSTRYDSLYLRSNGFVSLVQVLSALGLVLVLGLMSRRLVTHCGFRWYYLALWAGIAVLLGITGYMEYFVQRHASQAAVGYGIMSISLALTVAAALWMWKKADRCAAAHVTYVGKYCKQE